MSLHNQLCSSIRAIELELGVERLSIEFTEFKRLFIDDLSKGGGWMMNMNDFSIEMMS